MTRKTFINFYTRKCGAPLADAESFWNDCGRELSTWTLDELTALFIGINKAKAKLAKRGMN